MVIVVVTTLYRTQALGQELRQGEALCWLLQDLLKLAQRIENMLKVPAILNIQYAVDDRCALVDALHLCPVGFL
jgi:hypothetical protein